MCGQRGSLRAACSALLMRPLLQPAQPGGKREGVPPVRPRLPHDPGHTALPQGWRLRTGPSLTSFECFCHTLTPYFAVACVSEEALILTLPQGSHLLKKMTGPTAASPCELAICPAKLHAQNGEAHVLREVWASKCCVGSIHCQKCAADLSSACRTSSSVSSEAAPMDSVS